jgi:hypothetical protein
MSQLVPNQNHSTSQALKRCHLLLTLLTADISITFREWLDALQVMM